MVSLLLQLKTYDVCRTFNTLEKARQIVIVLHRIALQDFKQILFLESKLGTKEIHSST